MESVDNENVAQNPISVTENTVFENSSGQAYNAREQELLKEYAQARLERGETLEYINLNDYLVPHPAHFNQLAKPTVSIKYPHITFSASCIRLFEGMYYVLPTIAKTQPKIAFVPLKEEELSSLQWAREKDGKVVSKTISAPGFLNDVYARMKWSRKIRYKSYGYIADSARGLCIAFDLNLSAWIPGTFTEEVNKETGEIIKKHKDILLPGEYKNKAGMDFSDYENSHQMDLFTDFPELMTTTYEDLPEELRDDTE